MGKRMLSLYVDDEIVLLAKAKGTNISALFNEILRIDTEIKESKAKTEIEKKDFLKLKIAKLSTALNEANKKIKELENSKKQEKMPKERYCGGFEIKETILR
jgi:hypothetical protein